MRLAAYLLGLGVLAGGVSFGVSGLQAQQSTLMNFCPAKPGTTACSAAATMLVSASDPSDDQLVSYITAIAAAQHSSRGCGDTAAGLAALVGAIDNATTRGLAQQVVDRLCGVHTASTGGNGDGELDPKTLHDIVYGVDKGSAAPGRGSGCQPPQTSGGTSGSSGDGGQSSGSSGQSSGGTSGSGSNCGTGQSSGSSGQSSGGTSGSSGSSGQSSGGTSGSSGSSGQSSGGTSGA